MAAPLLLENAFVAADAGQGLGGLFHRAEFFRLHAPDSGAFFEWVHEGKPLATVHFSPSGEGLWRSPARGTFAGFASVPELPLESLFDFHDAVLARLVVLGAQRVELLPPPMAHDPVAFANQFYVLRSRGWEIGQCDLNHSLEVDSRGLGERMSYGNLKRLRKCEREGLVAQVLPIDALPEVYDTLAANRAAKGHAMSMTLAQLQTMAERLPHAMQLFGARAHGELVASALCLRLDARVLYVLYWGDRPGYASLSPVVAVADAVYRHAQAEGFAIVDVGTSTLDREPNPGLIQFKRALGFTESLKLRMLRAI